MISRIASLALLLSAVASQTAANTVSCRVEIDFDDKPDDVAWELRGPLPGIQLIAQKQYDDYDPETHAHQSTIEKFDCEEGKSYYFLITDYDHDGIAGGAYKVFAELPTGDILLEEGKGESIGSGKAFNFVVPVVPQHLQSQMK